VKDNPRIIVNLNEDDKDKLVKACQGLTRCEAENAMYKAVVSRGRLDSRDVDAILSEKEQIISRVFGKYLGESEERMRKAIAVAEGVAPAILWVDELEKALAGATGGGGDSGVSSRVFGSLLTWMEEKDKPVFVVATANDISRIPPELLRKGRMDEIFFVDLPTPQERAEISCRPTQRPAWRIPIRTPRSNAGVLANLV
jgi:AAA+ superfamily predicted ATPase